MGTGAAAPLSDRTLWTLYLACKKCPKWKPVKVSAMLVNENEARTVVLLWCVLQTKRVTCSKQLRFIGSCFLKETGLWGGVCCIFVVLVVDLSNSREK